jgi:hypothetical protein
MQPFTVSMGNNIFTEEHEIHISTLEPQRWSLEFDVGFRFG